MSFQSLSKRRVRMGLCTWLTAGAIALCGPHVSRAQEQPNILSSQERAQHWQLLFNGRTLTGWQAAPTSSAPATGDWAVEDGSILCPGTTAGWLATTDSFSDFELKLQFRGGAKVNSGVFLRSAREGAPHKTGYELQIWDYQPEGYSTGSLVGYVKAPATRILPDVWNDYDITAVGDHFVVLLNGKPLLDAHDAAHGKGLIGLQCGIGSKIEFRNIKVRPITR